MVEQADVVRTVPNTWPEGKILDNKWTIEKYLGSGGFASIFQAKHRSIKDRKAIVKRLREDLNNDPTVVAAFMNEAATMNQLDGCAYVVQLLDAGKSDDHFEYICMEYLGGGSLASHLKTNGALEISTALAITRNILLALEAAHPQNIFHLDINPHNILLKGGEGPPSAKLGDFGLAASITETTTAAMAFKGYGTIGYSPLEQLDGTSRSELDGRADLFSLGMTLFQMMTGQQAFNATSENWRVLLESATVPSPSQVRPDVRLWDGLDEFVGRLTKRKRDQRYPSAAQALRALEAIRNTGSVEPVLNRKRGFRLSPSFAALAIIVAFAAIIGFALFQVTAQVPAAVP